MNEFTSILVTGGTGLLGDELVRQLRGQGYKFVVSANSKTFNLLNERETFRYIKRIKPDVVFHCAAMVGGIGANSLYQYEFLMNNLVMQNNIIRACQETQSVKKFFFMGSSCIYPQDAEQPMSENLLFNTNIHESNRPYALAKLTGVQACMSISRQEQRTFLPIIPCNIYGFKDAFQWEHSHVIPAIIRKIQKAKSEGTKSVELWGTGTPKREFIFSVNLANILIELANSELVDWTTAIKPLNIGSGEEATISLVAAIIAESLEFEGEIVFNGEVGNGVERKVLDCSRLYTQMKKPSLTPLHAGIHYVVTHYLINESRNKK